MKYFVILNEFTLLRTLVLEFLRKPIYLMPSEPIFAPLTSLFDHISTWMENRTEANSVFDLLPEARKCWDIINYSNHIGGLPETVGQDVGGYCVAAADVEGHPGRIISLFEDVELCKQVGAAGHARFRKLFTTERMAKEYADMVRNDV